MCMCIRVQVSLSISHSTNAVRVVFITCRCSQRCINICFVGHTNVSKWAFDLDLFYFGHNCLLPSANNVEPSCKSHLSSCMLTGVAMVI
jgi:hypothetical protein